MPNQFGSDTDDPQVQRTIAEFNRGRQFGTRWSVAFASESAVRFSENHATGQIRQQIWDLPGQDYENLLQPADGNLIDTVSSSSVADDAQAVVIDGMYFDTDLQFQRHEQTVPLNGQASVTLPQPLCRVNNMFAVGPAKLTGNVYVYETGVTLNGIPSDFNLVHGFIDGIGGSMRQLKGAVSTARNEALVFMSIIFTVTSKKNEYVEFFIETRSIGSAFWRNAFVPITLNTLGNPTVSIDPRVLNTMPPNSDLRISAQASSDDIPAHNILLGLYAKEEP